MKSVHLSEFFVTILSVFLQRFPKFQAFQKKTKPKQPNGPETQEEVIENAYQQLRTNLANELFEEVKSCSSGFFEKLVVELLVIDICHAI